MITYFEKAANKEYENNTKLIRGDVEQLKQWVEKQPHLPPITDMLLIQIYHTCKYSLRGAKELIDTHYTFRTTAPEFFPRSEYTPPRYKYEIWNVCNFAGLPKLTTDGSKIVYGGLKDYDPSKYQFEAALREFVRSMLAIIVDTGSCDGYHFIFDIKGITISHLATVNISLVRKFLYFTQEAIPVNLKGVHIVNVTPIIDRIMFLVRPFLKKQLLEMIHIHSDLATLHEIIPEDYLVEELGGALPSILELSSKTKDFIEQIKDEIENELSLCTDETKRQGARRTINQIEMEGSFKKLSID